MKAVLLAMAAAALAGAPEAPPEEDCAAAYDKNYDKDWKIARETWLKDCEQGRKPKEILKDRQGDFVHECRHYFSSNKKDDKTPDWKIQVECAQGTVGERRLAEMTGVPFRAPPPPQVPAIQRLYTAVRNHGVASSTPMDLLPKGQPHRYLPIGPFKVWLMEGPPEICVLDTRRLDPVAQGGPFACADGSSTPRYILDEGCTGKRESMKFKSATSDQPETCSQADIDRLAEGIRKVLAKKGAASE